MKNVKKHILRMIALLFVAGLCLMKGKGSVLAVQAAPLEKAETREVKVLVIAIDPANHQPHDRAAAEGFGIYGIFPGCVHIVPEKTAGGPDAL